MTARPPLNSAIALLCIILAAGGGCSRGLGTDPGSVPTAHAIMSATPSQPAPELVADYSSLPFALAFTYEGDIYVLTPGEPSPKRITELHNCHTPAWSRDGERLAFARDLDYKLPTGAGDEQAGEVWVCRAGTDPGSVPTDAKKIAGSSDGGLGPGISAIAWDPDGRGMVVLAGLAATSGGLWHLTLDGEIQRGELGCNGLQPVSLEASEFAVIEHNYTRGYGAEEVFLINGALQRVSYATELTDLFPTFSPNCDVAAVVEPDDVDRDWLRQKDRIYLITKPAFEDADWLEKNVSGDGAAGHIADPHGLPARAVSVHESDRCLHSLAWSSDGVWLAFIAAERVENPNPARAELYALNINSGTIHLILTDVSEPTWRPFALR